MKKDKNYVWVTEATTYDENNRIKGIGIISVERDPKEAIKWVISQGAIRTGYRIGTDNDIEELTYKKYNTKYGYRLTKKMLFE